MFNDDKELRLAFSSQYPTFLKHVAQAGYPFICHVASCLNWYKKIGGFLGSVLSCKATLSHYTLLFRLEFAFHTFVSKHVLSTSLITFGHCQLVYTNKNTFKSINTINNSKRKNGE